VLAFAQQWRREATSGVIVDVPQGGPTDRAATDSLREIHSILAASGVPRNAVYMRKYRPSATSLADGAFPASPRV
jgi:pilus assembly protein CpaD